jgi:hypothetical protein
VAQVLGFKNSAAPEFGHWDWLHHFSIVSSCFSEISPRALSPPGKFTLHWVATVENGHVIRKTCIKTGPAPPGRSKEPNEAGTAWRL